MGLTAADGSQVFKSDCEQVGLVPQCARAKDLCFAYNYQTRPSDLARRQALLADLLGQVGCDCQIAGPFTVDNGFNILGSYITLGANVSITAVGHPIDAALRNQGIEYAYPITIGSYVWIGAGSCVLPGVTIGSHVVIEAGSVVNRSLPEHVVAAGNPCRVVRSLSAADEARYLGAPLS